MRALSSALLTELGKTVTRPGYLIEIDFEPIVRLSSFGDVTWNGNNYLGYDVTVSRINDKAAPTITLQNYDLLYGALVLNQGVSDRAVRIYTCYAGATATADVVAEFFGVGDSATVGQRVAIMLAREGTRTQSAPRRFVNRGFGFNHLLPAGKQIKIGAETYTLERR